MSKYFSIRASWRWVPRRLGCYLCGEGEKGVQCFRAWLGALGPIATILVAIRVAQPQMEAARDSAVAAGKSLAFAASTQRAWVSPTGIVSATPAKAGQHVNVSVLYSNSGKEPALNVVQRHELHVVDGELSDHPLSYEFPKPLPSCVGVKDEEGGIVIYPLNGTSGQHKQRIDPTSMTDGTRRYAAYTDKVMNRTAVVVATGCFGYKAGELNRISSYCYWLDGSATPDINQWNWTVCEKGHFAN